MKTSTVLVIAGLGGVAAFFVAAAVMQKPQSTKPSVNNIPPTPGTSSSIGNVAINTLLGISGVTALQLAPDTGGTSIAPTNP